MTRRPDPDPILATPTLRGQLTAKSRARREGLERLALSSLSTRRRNDLLPSIVLSYLPLRTLKRSARKLRRLDPAHIREVAAAIGTLGFCDPLLIGRDNEIIHGEIRFEAALQLGIDQVPCVRIDHLTHRSSVRCDLRSIALPKKGNGTWTR
jgi:ParB-like nuclease domain